MKHVKARAPKGFAILQRAGGVWIVRRKTNGHDIAECSTWAEAIAKAVQVRRLDEKWMRADTMLNKLEKVSDANV